MSYTFRDYKDEDQILESYSQHELEVRDEYMNMIEGQSTELIYEPVDFEETDPRIINKVIGPCEDFKDALRKYIEKVVEIFFTIDPYDLIPMALDLLDHYMNTHKDKRLPFDPCSGRSSSEYMAMIRDDPQIKSCLLSEESEQQPPAKVLTPPSKFLERIHTYIKEYKLTPNRIYQLDWIMHKFTIPDTEGKLPWLVEESNDDGTDYTSFQLCFNGEGKLFSSYVERNYDLNKDTFTDFLNELKKESKPSKSSPILLLMCRKIKALSLEVLYNCYNDGIILCAFPAYSKNLEPLSCHIIPSIVRRFNKKFQEKFAQSKDAQAQENVENLMKAIINQVQMEKVDRLKKDFHKVLMLDQTLNFEQMEVDEEGKGEQCSSSSGRSDTSGSQKNMDTQSQSSQPSKK